MASAKDVYASVRERLQTAGVSEPDAKARVIVAEALEIQFSDIFLQADVNVLAIKRIDEMA